MPHLGADDFLRGTSQNLCRRAIETFIAPAQRYFPYYRRWSQPVRQSHYYDPANKYALDITELNAFGIRTRAARMFPDDASKYTMFGAEIVAPCAGEVISAERDLPNRAPLDPDSNNRTGGNHVVIFCQGHSV